MVAQKLKNLIARSPFGVAARGRRAMRQIHDGGEVKLHLGCGFDHKPGYINIDVLPATGCDLVRRVERLTGIPDGSVSLIEACHLVEHLDVKDLEVAVREWARVMRPGGELHLELPNLAVCLANVGKHFNADGYDLAMVGIYGYEPDIKAQGLWQRHKWGWTPETLGALLTANGFSNPHELPVQQAWREAAQFGRDMHLCAVRNS